MSIQSRITHIYRALFVFPAVPFQATLAAGAQAYSPDGLRPWGDAKTHADGTVTISGFLRDLAIVDSPRWDNGKRWAVASSVVTPVDETQPEPEPLPEPTVDPNDVMVHYVGGIEVERFYREINVS